MIEQRELALSQLELFERTASDPSRFFVKGVVHTNFYFLWELHDATGVQLRNTDCV